jgi:hypothetical protein
MNNQFVWSSKFSSPNTIPGISHIEDVKTKFSSRHYLCIILVADCTNLIGTSGIEWHCDPNVFVENKKVWQKYMHSDKDILVLFGNDDNTINSDFVIDIESQTLTVKEPHGYMFATAALKWFSYINKLFSYDYLVCTTSSSFFVLPKLKHELIHNTAKTRVYKGRPMYHEVVPYISGSGYVMSPDVVQMLADGGEYIRNDLNSGRSCANDLAFGRFLYEKHNILMEPKEWWYDFDDNSVDNLEEKIKNTDMRNIVHYRIKNPANRLYFDTVIMNHLYNYYYT